MKYIELIKNELKHNADTEKAVFLSKFFKAFPGGCGEGDVFIGITVPHQRKVAKKYFKDVLMDEIEQLLRSPVHEYRLVALFIMVYRFEKSNNLMEQKKIVDLYLNNISHVNNWDLVDSSADKILGPYLYNADKDIIYEFANSDDLWKQRISVMTTFHFIRNGRYAETFDIAKMLLNHKHDLIHKAVGWMLREIGKRDFQAEFSFLIKHYRKMPRTMLRYAIEKFEDNLRLRFLKGLV